MTDANAALDQVQKQSLITRYLARICGAVIIFFILAVIVPGPIGYSPEFFARNANVQKARTINLLMFSYSNDNQGDYPDGQSSTEVFQKLIDEKYCNDPTIFYIPLLGKTPPVLGERLKPENVSFDVTSGLGRGSSDYLPVVFATGYKVSYTPGSAAIPLIKPFPIYGWEDGPGFIECLTGWRWRTLHYSHSSFIAVSYKDNSAMFIAFKATDNAEGLIPNFISPAYKPDGRTYRQLTPNGPLP